jgi:5-hydroxyisourate hydrolase-like protein (transthyretin family)
MVSVVVRRRVAWVCCASALVALAVACGRGEPTSSKQAAETLARTEFTERIENFFEYEPLKAGKPSAFLIHLTDLSDGAPVEKADVTLVVRREQEGRGVETKAKVGKVVGIYVAEVTVPTPGRYTIEFHVKNARLDERMVLDDFTTGGSS